MAEEQGQVAMDHAAGFRNFALGMEDVKGMLRAVSRAHLDLAPPRPTMPLADMLVEMTGLQLANNAAVERLAQYATRADRGLTGLAYVATYVGTNFPAADEQNRDRIAQLSVEGLDSVPPVPEGAQPVDARYLSPGETMAQRDAARGVPVPTPPVDFVPPAEPG